MTDEVDEVREGLRTLTSWDFDYFNTDGHGTEILHSICRTISDRGAVLEYAEDMFVLMERLDDADLDSPGPLVHTLETARPDYEPHLVRSIRRKPTRELLHDQVTLGVRRPRWPVWR